MKIGFLWHCVYPWDIRLEKMIGAVIGEGNTACVICKSRPDLPRREQHGALTIRRVVAPPRLRWINRLATFPLFFNPLWIQETRQAMREEELDILIVRDVPLAMLAAQAGKRLGKPVVLDMAENYPAALVSYNKLSYKPLLLGDAWLPRRYERICLSEVDHVFVVAEEQRLRLFRLGMASPEITLIGNTPVDSFLRSANAYVQDPSGATPSSLNLLYVGFIDPHRGADIALRALPELLKDIPTLTLTLVGDGTARQSLIALAEQLGIAGSVSFPGWVDFGRVPDYIRHSDVCIIPHLESEHTNTTLPNKLFDYMAFAKPIVASDCKPIQRVIEEADCGITFKSGDVADFVRAVKQLIRDPSRDGRGRSGRMAIERKYNWEIDKKVFLQAIETIGRGEYDRSSRAPNPVYHYC